MGSNADVINEAYAAFAKGDVPGLLELVDDGVDWVSPATLPHGGHFTGKDGVLAFFQGIGTTWESLIVEAEGVGEAEDDLVLAVVQRSRTAAERRQRRVRRRPRVHRDQRQDHEVPRVRRPRRATRWMPASAYAPDFPFSHGGRDALQPHGTHVRAGLARCRVPPRHQRVLRRHVRVERARHRAARSEVLLPQRRRRPVHPLRRVAEVHALDRATTTSACCSTTAPRSTSASRRRRRGRPRTSACRSRSTKTSSPAVSRCTRST